MHGIDSACLTEPLFTRIHGQKIAKGFQNLSFLLKDAFKHINNVFPPSKLKFSLFVHSSSISLFLASFI